MFNSSGWNVSHFGQFFFTVIWFTVFNSISISCYTRENQKQGSSFQVHNFWDCLFIVVYSFNALHYNAFYITVLQCTASMHCSVLHCMLACYTRQLVYMTFKNSIDVNYCSAMYCNLTQSKLPRNTPLYFTVTPHFFTVLHCFSLYSTLFYCTPLYPLYFTELHCTPLYSSVLHCNPLYSTVLHCTPLYSTVIHCTPLYLTVLHCTSLYFTVLHSSSLPSCGLTWNKRRNVRNAGRTNGRTDLVLLYTALHYTALHCTPLHQTALHCTALYCTALHQTELHCTRHGKCLEHASVNRPGVARAVLQTPLSFIR